MITVPMRSMALRGQLPIQMILALSLVLNSLGITWGLPNYLDWAADSIVPFDMLRGAYLRFSNGWADVYPFLPYAVMAVLTSPFMGYLILSESLQSPTAVFPFGLADPLFTFTVIVLIARVVSMLLGVGIVFVTYLIVQEMFERRSGLFAALIVTLYYPLIYYAHNANVDVPYLFWSLWAFYFFVRLLKCGQLREYILFAVFGTLAICTKDQAYGLFLLSPLPILWTRYKESTSILGQKPTVRWVCCDKRLIAAALVSIGVFSVGHNLLFNFSGFVNHVQLITGRASRPYAAYEATIAGRVELFWETLSQLALGLTPPMFIMCVVGCGYCALKKTRYSLPVMWLAVSYYFTFINVVRYVPMRFVLPFGIMLAFFGGKLLADIWDWGRVRTIQRVGICVLYGFMGLFAIQLDLLLINDPRYEAEEWLQENAKEGAIIETFAPRVSSLKHYPRLSPSVKVRSSKLEAGTQWVIRETRADQRVLPNIYEGKGSPDYVILSKYWYGELLLPEAENTEQARVLKDIIQGRTGYHLVASFETPTLLPISGLPINPRIDIFARDEQFR